MKQTLINDPIHNPFHNRFHVPVHSRLDEMQAHTHMVWLKDPGPLNASEEKHDSRPLTSALAGGFALVIVVVFSVALLTNVLGK